jgi:hypothetical protein
MVNSSYLFWLVVNVHAMIVILCTVHHPELAPSLPDDALRQSLTDGGPRGRKSLGLFGSGGSVAGPAELRLVDIELRPVQTMQS